MTPTPPIGSVAGIESLILFATTIFTQIYALFKHPTAPMPISAAPDLISALHATPNITDVHRTIITNAVNAAVSASTR